MKKIVRQIPNCTDCDTESKVFCNLTSQDKDALSEGKGHNFYKKGQTIFYEGNHSNGLYCIYEGKISLTKLGEDGKRQVVRFAKAGDILGYRSLLSDDSYQATATALEDCHICFIQKEKILDMMSANPSLARNSMQLLANDLRTAEQRLISISQKTVKERIAESLILLQKTFGFEEDGKTLNITLTRSEIADTAGTTTETTIRTLATLNEENLINLVGKKIIILNLNALMKTAAIYD